MTALRPRTLTITARPPRDTPSSMAVPDHRRSSPLHHPCNHLGEPRTCTPLSGSRSDSSLWVTVPHQGGTRGPVALGCLVVTVQGPWLLWNGEDTLTRGCGGQAGLMVRADPALEPSRPSVATTNPEGSLLPRKTAGTRAIAGGRRGRPELLGMQTGLGFVFQLIIKRETEKKPVMHLIHPRQRFKLCDAREPQPHRRPCCKHS